ncbi:MAG: hypothetical protein EPO26_06145 [Chloroflexota bacterium]|nr:MAG: hypothetical protein EPO26_06145 [Chloroflexota bacterium]
MNGPLQASNLGPDDRGTLGQATPNGAAGSSARGLIAFHEAGHAAVGHSLGLTFGVIYVGDASGQIIFDEQWDREMVVHDADLLDRYGLMLLAGGHAEQRYVGGVFGAQRDGEILERMLAEARRRGTMPIANLWQRAERQVAERWTAIEALADELENRGAPISNLAEVLTQYPYLGRIVAGTSGARARAILDANQGPSESSS